MAEIVLSEQQKGVVRRYVETWRRWRPGIRAFARLEEDLDKRYEILVDGIAVDDRPGGPVITADGKDSRFHAAIFGNDDTAVPEMTAASIARANEIRGFSTSLVMVRNCDATIEMMMGQWTSSSSGSWSATGPAARCPTARRARSA